MNFSSAITGSLGNARMIISSDQYEELQDLNGKDIVTIERTLLVRNVNNVPLNITLVADPESEEFIEVIDENFILEPATGNAATEKKARFNINIKNYGGYDGRINVLFAPIGVDEPGVALSSTIVVNAKKDGEEVDPDLEDDTDDEIIDDDGDSVSPLTGLASGGNFSNGILLLGISTIVLIIILIVLMRVMKKKKQNATNNKIQIIKQSEKETNGLLSLEKKVSQEIKETKLHKKEVKDEKQKKPKEK